MKFPTSSALALAALLLHAPPVAAADALHKCKVNGSVTYQRDPCPSDGPRDRPTVEQLNAERKKKLLEAKPAAATDSRPVSTSSPSPSLAPNPPVSRPLPSTPSRASYTCDGRQHCSQMTSCSEARYFLANCPNVKMDGDNDGIPCEDQWCR